MIKTLVLIRHAQAEPPKLAEDYKRKLTAKGKSDANELGYLLKEQGLSEPIIFCSHAERAINTAKLIAPAVAVEANSVHINETLYDSSVPEMFNFITQLKEDWAVVVIVAHNPTISYTTEYLTNETVSFSPSSAATIQFEVAEWKMVTQSVGKLLHFKTVF